MRLAYLSSFGSILDPDKRCLRIFPTLTLMHFQIYCNPVEQDDKNKKKTGQEASELKDGMNDINKAA